MYPVHDHRGYACFLGQYQTCVQTVSQTSLEAASCTCGIMSPWVFTLPTADRTCCPSPQTSTATLYAPMYQFVFQATDLNPNATQSLNSGPTTDSTKATGGLGGSPVGAIVGGIIGAAVVLIIVIAVLMLRRRRRERRQAQDALPQSGDDDNPPWQKPELSGGEHTAKRSPPELDGREGKPELGAGESVLYVLPGDHAIEAPGIGVADRGEVQNISREN